MLEEIYSVLIVGCGNIAGGFDYHLRLGDLPCTHAGAYSLDGRFRMQACVDPNSTVLENFRKYWKIPFGFSSLDAAIESDLRFDIVSICSPTQNHLDDVRTAIKLKPKLIFCEKPLTEDSAQTASLLKECDAAGILLCVNYTRRWDPAVIRLKEELDSESNGVLRSVVATYNKGILNNGSHLVDLLHFLLGDLAILAVGRPIEDYSPKDFSYPVMLEDSRKVPIHFVCGHAADYALFEVQFIFAKSIVSMREGGMVWHRRRAVENHRFSGYLKLDAGSDVPGEYPQAMLRSLDNIFQAVSSGQSLASTGLSALKAQSVCEAIASF